MMRILYITINTQIKSVIYYYYYYYYYLDLDNDSLICDSKEWGNFDRVITLFHVIGQVYNYNIMCFE
jgi:hypothetical protein